MNLYEFCRCLILLSCQEDSARQMHLLPASAHGRVQLMILLNVYFWSDRSERNVDKSHSVRLR